MNFSIKNIKDNMLNRRFILINLFPTVYWIITFYTERFCYDTSLRFNDNHAFTFVLVKVLLLIILLYITRLLYNAMTVWRDDFNDIIIYAMPYFLWAVYGFGKHGYYPLIGDEANIFNEAIKYSNRQGHFTYLTTYYHMLCLMIIPNQMGIVIIKIVLSSVSIGYVMMRMNKIYHSKFVMLLYGLFLMWPSKSLNYSVHRLPLHGLVYML